jgi:hypothetical protein
MIARNPQTCFNSHFHLVDLGFSQRCFVVLTLYLLTWRIWWAPNNASKEQTGFNLAFKGSSHVGCDAVSLGEMLTTTPRITMPSLSGWLYPEDKGTLLSPSLSKCRKYLPYWQRVASRTHFNYITVFLCWFQAKFGVCFPFTRHWGIFPRI